MSEIKEINNIIFGILSPKEIIDMSVCQITSSKLSGSGSVYDERMGSNTNNDELCVTCRKIPKYCHGHFGHIELNECIIHPLYYRYVVNFLKCFCIKCNRLLLTKNQIEIDNLDKFQNEQRFAKILKSAGKIDICGHDDCGHPHPTISYSTTDHSITMTYKQKIKKENNISIVLSVDEIKKIFDSVPDTDIILCGFDPSRIHPKNLIISIFPVLPPCARPFVISDDGNMCDDDLTSQLVEIIKSNNILGNLRDNCDEKKEVKRQKALQTLKFRISTFYDNSNKKAKHPTNARPIKGLKERLTGKDGQLRNNLMGKRVEFSARTVIGPDPCLRFGEIGLPKKIAEELTIPERVTKFNHKYLTKLVNEGHANYVILHKKDGEKRLNLKYALHKKGTQLLYNDIVIRDNTRIKVVNGNIVLKPDDKLERDGKIMEIGNQFSKQRDKNKLFYPTKREIHLRIGDEVYRHLRDGDIVLLNRQPTLHKGSMLAKRVKIISGKTIKLDLSTTKTFNADFDGDEMNIHVPQSLTARTELELLAATKYNIISAQASKPNIAIVQDSLLAAFLMTKENNPLSKGQFFNISMNGKNDGKPLWTVEKIKTIRKVLKLKKKKPKVFNGKGLISLLLPNDLIYEKENKANPDEPVVKIYRGVLYEGTLDKTILGSSHNSLIQIINKEYGVEKASEFITNIQWITNSWLLVNGFSVGLEDCMITSVKSSEKIQDKISRCYVEADGIERTTHNPGIREVRITASLSKAKDVGMRIAKETMSSNNNLLSTVHSGSKGDFFNIAQLTGLLGQQNLLGKRVQHTLNHGKRTLPHYPFGKLPTELEYESRGFIRHSFIEGLNPKEFWFHCMSGREGICDTAMGTSKTGYIQRRTVKICEDIQVQYDGTVRDTYGKIYQLAYGQTGFDPSCTVKVNGKQQPSDVSRIVNRLNLQFKLNRKKKK